MASIRPEKIFVTSNYSIEEIWNKDPTLVLALEHRFKVIDARAWKQWNQNDNARDWHKFKEGVTYWDRTMWINGVLQPGSEREDNNNEESLEEVAASLKDHNV